MDVASIKDLVQTQFQFEAEWEEEMGRLTLPAEHILPVCEFLWKNPSTYFDSLSCLTAIDQGPEAGKMEVIYTLYSIPNLYRLFHLSGEQRIGMSARPLIFMEFNSKGILICAEYCFQRTGRDIHYARITWNKRNTTVYK
jgi:hypothetical protein